MDKVGRDGVITVEESKSLDTELDVVEGMQFDKGYISPYFVTDSDAMEAVLEDAYMLIHEKKVAALKDLLPVLEQVAQTGKPLLILSEDVEGEALATLVVNKLRGTLNIAAVKAPGFGDRRKEMLKDIAAVTGGEVISEELGTSSRTCVSSSSAVPSASASARTRRRSSRACGESATSSRLASSGIRGEIENTDSDYAREKLQERLAKLAGGVAVIRVGAATETELKEKKHRFEDALSTARSAVEEGIVAGGGVTLIHCIAAVKAVAERLEGDERTGVRILMRALEEPARQIAANAGAEGSVVVNAIMQPQRRQVRLRRRDRRRVHRRHARRRHRRPGEGDAHGPPERCVDRRRCSSPRRRSSPTGRRRRTRAAAAACPTAATWAAWAGWTSEPDLTDADAAGTAAAARGTSPARHPHDARPGAPATHDVAGALACRSAAVAAARHHSVRRARDAWNAGGTPPPYARCMVLAALGVGGCARSSVGTCGSRHRRVAARDATPQWR
jgi:hypothetical protein